MNKTIIAVAIAAMAGTAQAADLRDINNDGVYDIRDNLVMGQETVGSDEITDQQQAALNKLAEAASQYESTVDALSNAIADRDALQESVNTLQANLDQAYNDLEIANATHRAELQALEGQIESLKDELNAANNLVVVAQAAQSAAEAARDAALAQVSDLEIQLTGMTAERDTALEAQAAAEQAQADAEAAQESAEAAKAAAEEALATAEEAHRIAIEAAEAKAADAEAKAEAAKVAQAAAEAAQATAEAAQAAAEQAKAAAEAAQASAEQAQAAAEQGRDAAEASQAAAEAAQATAEAAQAAAEAAQATAEAANVTLQAELDEANVQADYWQETAEWYKEQRDIYKADAEEWKEHYINKRNQYNNALAEIDELKEEITDLKPFKEKAELFESHIEKNYRGMRYNTGCVGYYNDTCADTDGAQTYGVSTGVKVFMEDGNEDHEESTRGTLMTANNTISLTSYPGAGYEYYNFVGYQGYTTYEAADGAEVLGHIAHIPEALIASDGEFSIITRAVDTSPALYGNQYMFVEVLGDDKDEVFHASVLPVADMLARGNSLMISSMENSQSNVCNSRSGKNGINECGELDTYIATTKIGISKTIWVSTTDMQSWKDGDKWDDDIIRIDMDGLGYANSKQTTSHAAMVLAAAAAHLAEAESIDNPVELKKALMEYIDDDKVLDYNEIMAL